MCTFDMVIAVTQIQLPMERAISREEEAKKVRNDSKVILVTLSKCEALDLGSN